MIFTTFCMGWGVIWDGKRLRRRLCRFLSYSPKGNDGGGRGGNALDVVGSFDCRNTIPLYIDHCLGITTAMADLY
jgi:hypothetical protein